MKSNVWMLAVAGCLAVAATADAQPGGGRGRGGPGGFGGFGGFGTVFGIVQNEAVQKDLGVGTDEAEKIKQVVDDYNADYRQGTEGLFGPNMSAEDREKVASVRKTTLEKYTPKLKAVLSADQFTRLEQIHWQNMGSAAYADPEVIKALTITKDQQDKIKSLNDEYQGKVRELFANGGGGGGGGGFGQNMEKIQEINKERDGKIDEVLTKDQLAKFDSMKGKKFDVAQLRQFGRGGRGGRGGPGGGGGDGARPKRPQPKAE